jgi:hypothetical protein
MPTESKINEYKRLISEKHPLLTDVYCVCDGLKVRIQASSDYHTQGMFIMDGSLIIICLTYLFLLLMVRLFSVSLMLLIVFMIPH